MTGMYCAVRGLFSIRNYFQLESYPKLFRGWLSRRPAWKKHYVLNAETGEITFTGMSADAEVWSPDRADYTMERRIEGIVKNIERLRDKQSTHSHVIQDLNKNFIEHEKMLARMPKELKSEINTNLKVLHTSDLSLSLMGLIYLIVGITLSTLSLELSKLCTP